MSDPEDDPEVEPVEPKNELKQEIIAENLSQVDNVGDTHAFTTLICEEKELEILGDAIKQYKYLRNINVSKNQLISIKELEELPNLLILKAVENQITDISFLSQDVCQFLQIVNLSQNKIKSLPPITPPYLKHLNLNENEIENCSEFTGHKSLEILELRKNKLVNCDGIGNLPKLRELYLAENPLVSINQLHTMPNLKKLNLRAWELEILELVPDLPRLEYLNLRETKIASLEEIKKLHVLENLIYLNLLKTPVSDDLADGVKKELILALPDLDLEKVNKELITDEDRKEAEELREERIKEEEERIRQEQAKAEGEGEGEGNDH